ARPLDQLYDGRMRGSENAAGSGRLLHAVYLLRRISGAAQRRTQNPVIRVEEERIGAAKARRYRARRSTRRKSPHTVIPAAGAVGGAPTRHTPRSDPVPEAPADCTPQFPP